MDTQEIKLNHESKRYAVEFCTATLLKWYFRLFPASVMCIVHVNKCYVVRKLTMIGQSVISVYIRKAVYVHISFLCAMPRKPGSKEVTDFMRGRIIGLKEAGKSQRDIVSMLNIPLSTVNNILVQFTRYGKISSAARSGRPGPSARLLRRIGRLVESDHRITASKVALEISVSPNTARSYLKKLGYHGRAARRKPLLSPKNVIKRYLWSGEMRHKPPNFWENIIFSDESSFNQFSNGGRVWVWRRPDQEYDISCLQPTVKHSFSVMVWGAIWMNGRSKLIHCEGSINAVAYRNILQHGLLPVYNGGGISKQDSLFMQDGAPAHTARSTLAWLQQNDISCLKWTAQSPDMNPIEHMWFILDQAVRKRSNKPSNRVNLLEILQAEWEAIPQATINNLILSMPQRVSDLYHARGGSTRY